MTEDKKLDYAMMVALVAEQQSTCQVSKVGCVFMSENFHILSIGFNGAPSGMEHCTDNPCPAAKWEFGYKEVLQTERAQFRPACDATHAEINALLQVKQPEDVHKIIVTRPPCWSCTRALLNLPNVKLLMCLGEDGSTHVAGKNVPSRSRVAWLSQEKVWIEAGRVCIDRLLMYNSAIGDSL